MGLVFSIVAKVYFPPVVSKVLKPKESMDILVDLENNGL